MSKYTTEVRFICESSINHEESQGFYSTQTVIRNAAPHIFDFDFPIFDEEYRLPLEIKILRHYYTREICEETYGLWKLRLEDRLNTIMPYYNQLYRSALLSFNPFYDVDLTTNHQGSESGAVNESNSEIYAKNNAKNNESVEQGSDTNVKNGDNATLSENEKTVNGEERRNDENVKSGDNSNKKQINGGATNTHTGTVSDDRMAEHVISNNGSEENKNNENKTHTTSADYSGENANSSNTDRQSNTNTNSNTDKWTMFSDTPQGGIDGMSVPNSSAPSALANNMYLTNATHDITNENTNSETKEIGGSVNTGNESSVSNESGSENKTETRKVITDNIESGNAIDKNVKTYNENNTENNNTTETMNGDYVETSNGSGTSAKNENTSDKGNVKENYSEVGSNNYDKFSKNNEEGNESGNVDKIGNRVSTNTDEYLQHVVGKSGGMTYAAMLLEYRETFINIDEMIIEELSDLFFGLW